MFKGFWAKLKKPIMALAPMADVTDAAFRRMFAKYGKPSVLWTEFVSADGLLLGGEDARKALMPALSFTEKERPIVAQFFTSKPEAMEFAARLAADLGFDGVDINMGCPDKAVIRQNAGSALIKDPKLAGEIIRAAKRGAESGKRKIPVSVKTRIGWNSDELETWIPAILKEEPAALTIHGRTKKELSKVPADWDAIGKAREIRDRLGSETLVLGNGDVASVSQAKELAAKYGLDGVMIGRGAFGNPWFFNARRKGGASVAVAERLRAMIEHTNLFEKLFGAGKNFATMRKHYKAYANGFEGAKELRNELMSANGGKEVAAIVKRFMSDQRRAPKRAIVA